MKSIVNGRQGMSGLGALAEKNSLPENLLTTSPKDLPSRQNVARFDMSMSS
jgi:hypothetical protein